jgi:hypothetical protein
VVLGGNARVATGIGVELTAARKVEVDAEAEAEADSAVDVRVELAASNGAAVDRCFVGSSSWLRDSPLISVCNRQSTLAPTAPMHNNDPNIALAERALGRDSTVQLCSSGKSFMHGYGARAGPSGSKAGDDAPTGRHASRTSQRPLYDPLRDTIAPATYPLQVRFFEGTICRRLWGVSSASDQNCASRSRSSSPWDRQSRPSASPPRSSPYRRG